MLLISLYLGPKQLFHPRRVLTAFSGAIFWTVFSQLIPCFQSLTSKGSPFSRRSGYARETRS